jgi:uncharacterized protein YjbI with pentapeptide repeats
MRIIAPMMILIMMTSTLAGCTGGDDKMTKEELVEKIRNGEGFINGEHLTIGADLSGADLSGLQNSELYALDFTGANLEGTDFTNSDLSHATFDGASLKHTTFQDTNLEGTFFSGEYLALYFHDSNLQSATFTGVYDVAFYNSDLSWASFYDVTFSTLGITDSTLYATSFRCIEIESGGHFSDNKFESMNLNTYTIDCPHPQWGDTLFVDNTFEYVDLEGWYGDEYYGTVFKCNTFSNSELGDTDFSNAHFQTVYGVYSQFGYTGQEEVCEQTFRDSNMDGSTFGNFNNGTSFIGSTLALSSISSVHEEVTWYDTICPDQTNSNDNGNTCENNL